MKVVRGGSASNVGSGHNVENNNNNYLYKNNNELLRTKMLNHSKRHTN